MGERGKKMVNGIFLRVLFINPIAADSQILQSVNLWLLISLAE
jgi:hypothetical protein